MIPACHNYNKQTASRVTYLAVLAPKHIITGGLASLLFEYDYLVLPPASAPWPHLWPVARFLGIGPDLAPAEVSTSPI